MRIQIGQGVGVNSLLRGYDKFEDVRSQVVLVAIVAGQRKRGEVMAGCQFVGEGCNGLHALTSAKGYENGPFDLQRISAVDIDASLVANQDAQGEALYILLG